MHACVCAYVHVYVCVYVCVCVSVVYAIDLKFIKAAGCPLLVVYTGVPFSLFSLKTS